MASPSRITLFRNGSKGHGFLVFVPDSLEELLRVCSEKLQIQATYLFSEQGAHIDDVRLIRDNDVVYVAAEGEGFLDSNSMEDTSSGSSLKRKSDQIDSDDEPVKLFVGSIGPNLTQQEVQNMFSEYGSIVEVKLLTDKTTGKSRGAAFVRYASRAAGERAIAARNGTIPPGAIRPMTVKYAEGDPAASEAAGEFKLFVGSLPKETTQADLQKIFSQYGSPIEIVVLRSSKETRGAGAFVKYRFKREAQNAISGAHGMNVGGNSIVVRFADAKQINKPGMGMMRLPGIAGMNQLGFNQLGFNPLALNAASLAGLQRNVGNAQQQLAQLGLMPQAQQPQSTGQSGHAPSCPSVFGYAFCNCGATPNAAAQFDPSKLAQQFGLTSEPFKRQGF